MIITKVDVKYKNHTSFQERMAQKPVFSAKKPVLPQSSILSFKAIQEMFEGRIIEAIATFTKSIDLNPKSGNVGGRTNWLDLMD